MVASSPEILVRVNKVNLQLDISLSLMMCSFYMVEIINIYLSYGQTHLTHLNVAVLTEKGC